MQVFARGPVPIIPAGPTGPPNPGQILQNPTFLTQSGGYEFLNFMKMAFGGWTDGSGNVPSPANLDANGYPTALGAGGSPWSTNVATPDTSQAGASYVVYWNGTGTWSAFGAATFSGGGSGVNRGTFTLSPQGSTISPIQISVLPVTNIAIMLATDEADFLAGKITGSKLRQRIQQAQTPVFRNLNWWSGLFSANYTNVASWADRKPQGYVSYSFEEYKNSIFAGTTSNTGLAYTATLGGFTLQDKAKVMAFVNVAENNASTTLAVIRSNSESTNPNFIDWGQAHGFTGNEPVGFNGFTLPAPLNQFTTYYVVGSSISGNLFKISATSGGAAITITGSTQTGVVGARFSTLNVQSTGAFVIRDPFGQVHQANDNQLTAGTTSIWTFLYNATLNAWQSFNNGLLNGVPPEVFLQFCAELGCHPWLVSPYYACDPMTDWHTQHATYYKNNKPSWMVPRFECTNEPWNIFTPCGTMPLWMSLFNWGGYDEINYVAKIANTIGQDISAVLGAPDGTNYHLIVNMQNGPGPQNDMMNCPSYFAQGSTQPGYNNTFRTSHYLTHVCSDQYFGPQDYNTLQTSAQTTSGNVLHFAAPIPPWITVDTLVTDTSGVGTQIPPNTLIQSINAGAGTITLTNSVSSTVNIGDFILFSAYNLNTSAATGATGTTLAFTHVPAWVQKGMGISDIQAGATAAIPPGTTVQSVTSTTITLSQAVVAPGVGNGDAIAINFSMSYSETYRFQWVAAAGNPSLQQSIIDTALVDPIGGVPVNLASLAPQYAAFGSWAPTFTNSAGKAIGYCGYEGGFASFGGGNAGFTTAAKFGTNIQSYYTTNITNFKNGGGVHPAEFTISGPNPSADVWSILNDIYESPDPPQWLAVVSFNH